MADVLHSVDTFTQVLNGQTYLVDAFGVSEAERLRRLAERLRRLEEALPAVRQEADHRSTAKAEALRDALRQLHSGKVADEWAVGLFAGGLVLSSLSTLM